jgi:hypothetical protein
MEYLPDERTHWSLELTRLIRPFMQSAGFAVAEYQRGIQLQRKIGECSHSFLFSFEVWNFGLMISPKFSIRSIPLWEQTGPHDDEYGHIFGPLSNWLPARKRASRGGLHKSRCTWTISRPSQISLAAEEILGAASLVIPFMDQFKKSEDIFEGFKRGAFVSTPPKEQEWLRLVWEGQLDPIQSRSGYLERYLDRPKVWQLRRSLALGSEVSWVNYDARDVAEFFNEMEPYGRVDEDEW